MDILEDILGYFVLLQHHSDIKFRIRISDIPRFCGKWVDLPTGYSDISRIYRKFAILLLVHAPGTGTISAPQILILGYLGSYDRRIFLNNDLISRYLTDIWRKNIGYFQP